MKIVNILCAIFQTQIAGVLPLVVQSINIVFMQSSVLINFVVIGIAIPSIILDVRSILRGRKYIQVSKDLKNRK